MRITGGVFRSRAVIAPKGQETRPTSDRVREALFSMLTSDGVFDDAPTVLDLYAGSGALAWEALSRGASRVVLVENAPKAVRAIRENAAALDVGDRIEIRAIPALRALASIDETFDLIVIDPPYAEVRMRAFEDVLAAAGAKLAERGVLVLEHASLDAPSPATLVLDRRRRHGDTTVSLYRRPEPSGAG
jgi:16S rRNA (guanine966-N2)-methyltransferase